MILIFICERFTSKLKCKFMFRFSVVIQCWQTLDLCQEIDFHWRYLVLSWDNEFVLNKKRLDCWLEEDKVSRSNTDYKESNLLLISFECYIGSMLGKLLQNYIVIIDVFMIFTQLRKIFSVYFVQKQLL